MEISEPTYDMEPDDFSYEFPVELRDDIMQQTNESTEECDTLWKLAKEFRGLESENLNFVLKLHRAADNLGISLLYNLYDSPVEKNGLTYFESELRVDSILLATGQGLSQKSSRYKTYTISIEKLCSLVPVEEEMGISQESFCNPHRQNRNQDCAKSVNQLNRNQDSAQSVNQLNRKQDSAQSVNQLNRKQDSAKSVNPRKDVHYHRRFDFVLLQLLQTKQNSHDILKASSKFSETPIQFVLKHVNSGFLCQIYLGSQLVEECVGHTKRLSKKNASDKAVETLRLHCWTIHRNVADAGGETITREDILGNVCKIHEPISSDNIGNKLLQKMGWSGGGIGKSGNKGIAEPLSMQDVGDVRRLGNRTGLGNQRSDKFNIDFVSKIRSVLKGYAWSSDPDHLTFLGHFSSEEVNVIRREANKLGLSSKRKCLKSTPKLTVSHNWENRRLLNLLIDCGGSSRNYTISPPLQLENCTDPSSNPDMYVESYEDLTSVAIDEDLPPTIIDEDLPSTIVDEDLPSTIVDEDLPSTIVDEDFPSTIVDEDLPSTIVDKDLPSTIVDEDWPSTIVDEDLPSTIVDEDLPSTIVDEDWPSTIVDEDLTSVNVKELTSADIERFVSTNMDENLELEDNLEHNPLPCTITKQYVKLFINRDRKMNFRERVKAFLVNYSESVTQKKLMFSTEFTKKEESVIYVESYKLGLVIYKSLIPNNKPVVVVSKNNLISKDCLQVQMTNKVDVGVLIPTHAMHFGQTVEAVLIEYLKSSCQNDLPFSNKFGKKATKVIRQNAEKLGLDSRTEGIRCHRHVIISKNIKPQLQNL